MKTADEKAMTRGFGLAEVTLPRCPTCGHIGAIPLTGWSGKAFCTGALEKSHAKEKMLPVKFREVRGK